MAFSDWLWHTTGQTSGLTPEALVDALFDYLSRERGHDVEQVRQTLLADYLASGARARPACLREVLPAQTAPMPRHKRALSERQDRHTPHHPTSVYVEPMSVRPELVEGFARLRQAQPERNEPERNEDMA
jgi:hypothetical protein